MKNLFKLFIYPVLFIFALLAFLPKESLFNLLEKQLLEQKLIISNEIKEESLFSLKIKDANIYYEGIKVANVNKSEIRSYLFYSDVKINNVNLLQSLNSMFPSPIDSITLNHSIIKFDKVNIEAKGKFGIANGTIDLFNRMISLNIDFSPKMKSSYSQVLRNLKQKDGRYIYEFRF